MFFKQCLIFLIFIIPTAVCQPEYLETSGKNKLNDCDYLTEYYNVKNLTCEKCPLASASTLNDSININ